MMKGWRELISKNESGLKLVLCTPNTIRPAMLGHFIEQMKDQKTQGFHHALNFEGIVPAIQNDSALVVLSIFETDELFGALQFLGSVETRMKEGQIKVMVICRAQHQRITALLKSKGVMEVQDFTLSEKAFHFKIRQAMLAFHHSEAARNANASLKNSEIRPKAAVNPASSLRWLPEVEHDSDFWMIMNPKHIRYVIGKWFLNFYGPGPSEGVWQDSGLTLNGEKGWIYQPRAAGDTTFYQGEGRWIFYGNCPEFSWSLGLWYFISPKPFFAFYEANQVRYEKAWILESGDFGIRRNSKFAQSIQPLIQSTIEASIRLKNGASTELKGSFAVEESVELYARMEEQKALEKKRANGAYDRTKVSLAITSRNGVPVRFENCLELVALRETQAFLNVPKGMLELGDRIEVEAQLFEGKDKSKFIFKATTRVLETGEEDSDHEGKSTRIAAVCELDEAIQSHFTDLVEQFRGRREEMIGFFKKAKGV